MKKLLFFISTFFFWTSFAQAASFLVVEGRLTDSTGLAPIEAASVNFLLQVYSPGPEECLLYEETHTGISMTDSNGIFSLRLGSGTPGSALYANLTDTLDNSRGVETPTSCAIGSTYDAATGDHRRLLISFDAGNGMVALSQTVDIGSAAYAQSALSLDGLTSTDLIQVNTGTAQLDQASLESVFASAADVTELVTLIAGTSGNYVQSGALPTATVDNNGQIITNVGAPVAGDDATNKTYVDTNLGGQDVDPLFTTIGAAQDGQVLTWDNANTRWTVTTPTAVDNTKLPLDGTGIMTGNLQLGGNQISNDGGAGEGLSFDATGEATFGQGVVVTGGIGVGTGINSEGVIRLNAENELHFADGDDSNFLGFKAPNVVTADHVWTLPDGDGTSGQVLQTNGAGVLSWVSAGGGADDLGNHTATTNLDLNNNTLTNIAQGGVAAPSISFSGDANTGIFSPAADTLSFVTAGNEQLVISAAGEVGVGIVPAYPLDVRGAFNLRGLPAQSASLRLGEDPNNGPDAVTILAHPAMPADYSLTLPDSIGGAGQALIHTSAGQLGWQNLPNGDVADGGNIFGAAMTIGTNDANDLVFRTNGISAFVVDSGQQMDLLGNTVREIASGTPGTPGLSFAGAPATGIYAPVSPSIDQLGFITGGTERLRITDDGSIGIGVNAPPATLSVRKNSPGGEVVRVLDNTSQTLLNINEEGNIGFGINAQTGSTQRFLIDSPAGYNDVVEVLEAGTSHFVIKGASGNIGIGTANPVQKLSVDGAIKVAHDGANHNGACSGIEEGSIQKENGGETLLYCNGGTWVRMITQSCPAGYATYGKLCIEVFAGVPATSAVNTCRNNPGGGPDRKGYICSASVARAADMDGAITLTGGEITGDVTYNAGAFYVTVDVAGTPEGNVAFADPTPRGVVCCY